MVFIKLPIKEDRDFRRVNKWYAFWCLLGSMFFLTLPFLLHWIGVISDADGESSAWICWSVAALMFCFCVYFSDRKPPQDT